MTVDGLGDSQRAVGFVSQRVSELAVVAVPAVGQRTKLRQLMVSFSSDEERWAA